MYKLLNSTATSLFELLLLKSSNSKADFIVLAANIRNVPVLLNLVFPSHIVKIGTLIPL